MTDDRKLAFATVSVAVVCMSGIQPLMRCLEALRSQRAAPDFEVAVACDPRIPGIETARRQFPEARIVVNKGQRTPLELASRALKECRGELILLTKDHCVPHRDWVRTMVDAQREERAAVGGRVEIAPDASATDWAFYFVDFYRYAAPLASGFASSLTVCNVAYKRRELEAICDVWDTSFIETAVNDALRARFGALWMHSASEVTMSRHLTLREAIKERYVFGRLFGCSRLAVRSRSRRLVYALFAPALPLLLLGRMAMVALHSSRHAGAFLRSLVPLTLMVVGRSWGEWVAYVTGRLPRSRTAGADVREARLPARARNDRDA